MTDPLLISMLSHASDERSYGRWDVASVLAKGVEEIESLRARLAEAETERSVKDLTIKHLTEVVEDRGVSIGCMSRQLTECKERLAEAEAREHLSLHAEVTEWRNERDGLKQRLAEAEKREQELRVELAIEKAFHSDMELYYHLLHKRDEAAKGVRDDSSKSE